MRTENKFYLAKQSEVDIFRGRYHSVTTGEPVESSIDTVASTIEIPLKGAKRYSFGKLGDAFLYSFAYIHYWDSDNNYLGKDIRLIQTEDMLLSFDFEISNNNAAIIAIDFTFPSPIEVAQISKSFYLWTQIFPHYKQLKKAYKKESEQAFFRETLEGKITVWKEDYRFIKTSSLQDIIYFRIYRNNKVFASASFNKTDCKFDYAKACAELQLKYDDKYTKILNSYENTYDLLTLSPQVTALTATKRAVVQIYIQGEKVISNYSGGTYWETEVNEQIDDEGALLNKYYFSKGPKYIEVNLSGFNFDINATYRGLWDSNIWNATSSIEIGGVVYKMECSIVFMKTKSAGDFVSSDDPETHLLSTGEGSGVTSEQVRTYIYDTYGISIFTGRDGTGTRIYDSDKWYGKDGDFTLSVGTGLYPMHGISQPAPSKQPIPSNFNLGENVVEYQIWGRILCDKDWVDGQELYNLPYDDFATARRNYKKCIGIRGFNDNTVIQIYQSQQTIDEPTAYGTDDYGKYFIPPYTTYGQYFYPLSRSAWANTSLWVKLHDLGNYTFENFISQYYKEYMLKNSYSLVDVIKALLAKIDPSISHEGTSEYSQFLYGHTGATAEALGGCNIYITPKTNILKGEYDQAAQKADIKFKQLMDMLKDCFRCYWFIDKQNRFRIEHISYFTNGLSYDEPQVGIDLTKKLDKFNKKNSLYCQREVEFDKSDLASRYEFAWMDDATDAMGGNLHIDVEDEYIQKNNTEEINIELFSSDIDYMLFLPDDFSNDGFVLIMANNSFKIPINRVEIVSEKQFNNKYPVYLQNNFASFNQLISHYMLDMPGYSINCNNIENIQAQNIKKCMKHVIEIPSDDIDIDIHETVKTKIGTGQIEEMTINIDTNMTEIELRYEPS